MFSGLPQLYTQIKWGGGGGGSNMWIFGLGIQLFLKEPTTPECNLQVILVWV